MLNLVVLLLAVAVSTSVTAFGLHPGDKGYVNYKYYQPSAQVQAALKKSNWAHQLNHLHSTLAQAELEEPTEGKTSSDILDVLRRPLAKSRITLRFQHSTKVVDAILPTTFPTTPTITMDEVVTTQETMTTIDPETVPKSVQTLVESEEPTLEFTTVVNAGDKVPDGISNDDDTYRKALLDSF